MTDQAHPKKPDYWAISIIQNGHQNTVREQKKSDPIIIPIAYVLWMKGSVFDIFEISTFQQF